MKDEKVPSPTPYPELNTVLQHLVVGVREILRDDLLAAYLQGSFAIGGFDQHSDCDFIIVINEDVSESQLEKPASLPKTRGFARRIRTDFKI